jgi:uncharacterized protein (DUF305 family)
MIEMHYSDGAVKMAKLRENKSRNAGVKALAEK